jgi:PST family polysaccharide transporter
MTKQRSLLHAVKWSYTAIWGDRAFSALFIFILAAMVGPRDFGILAIALIYISFLQMLLNQGLPAALIQRKNLQPEHLDAVFWMESGLSIAFVAISVLLSRWWAAMNHTPQLAPVIIVLSLCIPIEGLTIVQRSLLAREMDFRSLSIRANVSMLVSGIVGISLAYGGCGVWALVGQQLTKDLSSLVLLWTLSSWRPRLEFSWRHLKDLLGFSASNFVAVLGVFVDASIGSILLGLFFGPVAVGLYRLADRAMNTILAAATSSVQSVSLPEFSRLQDNPAELRKSSLTCIRMSSTIALPALAGLCAISGPLMATIGPKWVSASGVLKILCILGMFLSLTFFTGPMLQALAKVRLAASLEWARTIAGGVVLVIAGYIARSSPVNVQILSIALARLVTGVLLTTPVFLYLLMRLTGISIRDLLASVGPSLLASVAVISSVLVFQSFGFLHNSRPAFLLTAEVVVGGLAAIPTLLMLEPRLRVIVSRVTKITFWSERLASRTVGES